MATLDDVRRICSKLPGAQEGGERFGFDVEVKGKRKGFVWSWMERIEPKKARVANDGVLAVMVPSLAAKEVLLSSGAPWLFTEPHYNGFPAVLVRLADAPAEGLEDLVIEAWRCKAPKDLLRQYEGG